MDLGDRVVQILSTIATACEKKSVDEVAIDITKASENMLQQKEFTSQIVAAVR
jgi:hypothetical protein